MIKSKLDFLLRKEKILGLFATKIDSLFCINLLPIPGDFLAGYHEQCLYLKKDLTFSTN